MMTSEIRAKKKAEAMLFLSLALLVELLLLFAAKILVQFVLSAALQQTLGTVELEWSGCGWGLSKADVGGTKYGRSQICHYDVMLKRVWTSKKWLPLGRHIVLGLAETL